MKTLRTILMVVMMLVTVFFVVLAQIQRGYAVEAQQEAEKLVEETIKSEKEAVRLKEEAQNQARQVRILEEKLAECTGK
ncbi:MAG: hypothetical protein R8G66_08015 [Cytophagales bacterium]|nr:hypothetical protein [Cytophagales bacterium]